MSVLTLSDLYKSWYPNRPSHSNIPSEEDWIKMHQSDYYSDDAYLEEISKYKDKSWYQYLLNNPFLAGNQQQWSPDIWQQIAEAWGDFSARDRYFAELKSQRSQWLANQLEQFRQQEYNEPINQASRELQAGINPDIAGNISPGDASENDQPSTPIQMPTSNAVQSVSQFGMSFISNLIGMAQSFQSLKMGSNQLVQQEIANNSSARDFVLNQIAGSSFFNSENDLDYISPADLANNILGASAKVDYSVYSPRTRKLIKKMFGTYAKDVRSGKSPMAVESLKSELRNRIASNNKSAVHSAGSPLFDEDFNTFLRKYASIVGKAEYDLQMEEYKTKGREQKARSAKSNFDTQYYHALDANAISESENTTAKANTASQKQTAIVEDLWSEVYKLCKDSNSWYGTLGLILLPYLRTMANTAVSGGLNLRGMITNETKNFNKIAF